MPYRSEYWNKYTNRQDIFEEDRNDANSTVILDESVIEEDVPAQQFGSVEERVEESILKSFKEGWEEGEYTVGNLKAMLDKQCK